jgi:hypothetical protein
MSLAMLPAAEGEGFTICGMMTRAAAPGVQSKYQALANLRAIASYSVRRAGIILVPIVLVASAVGCGPYLPPPVVPTAAPEFEPFRLALQDYVNRTQPYRREAAAQAETVSGRDTSPENAENAIRLRERAMADAIRLRVRPGARPGDLFSPPTADFLRRAIADAFASPRGDLIRDELIDQTEGSEADAAPPSLHQPVTAPRVPPLLLESLPALPSQVEFDFDQRTLILRDVDANIAIDLLPDALPETLDAPPSVPETLDHDASTTTPALPMPDIRGATTFAAIGDSGTGGRAQRDIAAAMLRYFTRSRRFPFVIMLGDNLYGDDYINEFSVPYKDLLDRGVKFYAALGNHDRETEVHYQPFNMNDRPYYAFTRGNARFVALNSNRPRDEAQLAWFDGAYGNTGTKWRIAFFHHPLYSSGEHARQSRDVIRPALEQALVRNKVDVVFSGHEHLYERVAPQQGVHYFVSGGGGRRIYDVEPSSFDEAAASTFHFMVLSIAGDRMFFAAVTAGDRVLDCGVLWRTSEAAARRPDDTTRQWLDECRTATRPAERSARRR